MVNEKSGYNPMKSIPILVTGESSPTKIRSASISSVSTELEDDAIFRKRWKSTYGFVLACIHLSLGLGNVWRFPYIAYRHGGGSFVIAYLIITVIIIIPLFFLETSLGQFSSRGPLAIWVISPAFKGIGYAMLTISTLAAMYFNMINSYSILFTFASLQEKLPWEHCNNWWNTNDCIPLRFVISQTSFNTTSNTFEASVLHSSSKFRDLLPPRPYNFSSASHIMANPYVNDDGFLKDCYPSYLPTNLSAVNKSLSNTSTNSMRSNNNYIFTAGSGKIRLKGSGNGSLSQSEMGLINENNSDFGYSMSPVLATEQYLKVFLGENLGKQLRLSWQLALGSLFIWIIVFAVLIKGHKFSGKVAYVACLYPFVLFIVIFIRVQSLTGARPGMIKFFLPDRRILTAEVWHDAVVQSFFSNFVCWGPIIMMASHNSFFNNLLRDSLVVPFVNSLAAIIIGVISFAIVSYISFHTCIPFYDVAPKDPSFIYVIYPVIISTFPISPLWGFLLFATITQLGINSQLFCVKTLITSIMDEKIPHFTKPLRIIFCTSLVLYLFGLIFATKRGVYLIEFVDFETTAWSLLAIALLECVIVSWVYGADHLLLDIRIILRRPLRLLWHAAWSYTTPLTLMIIIIVSILDNRDIILPYPLITAKNQGFDSKTVWITGLAWAISISPLIIIISVFVYHFLRTGVKSSKATPTAKIISSSSMPTMKIAKHAKMNEDAYIISGINRPASLGSPTSSNIINGNEQSGQRTGAEGATASGKHYRRLFFDRSRNRLRIKKEPPSQLTAPTLKERLIKCISATPEWGPFTENHQLLQQIAFRIQRCNHQILNKAVHKKAREIINLVNQSGSTNLCIKDLLFINPNAPAGKDGETRLQNIEDIGTVKMKAPRKYSLFDGYKEVVFMELPKDLMTKIDEPGVYTFLQPLDIDVPSNMILLPNSAQPDSDKINNRQDDSRNYYSPRFRSQDFSVDFPKIAMANESRGDILDGVKADNENMQKNDLWNKIKTAYLHNNEKEKFAKAALDLSKMDHMEKGRRGSDKFFIETDYPMHSFVFGRKTDIDHSIGTDKSSGFLDPIFYPSEIPYQLSPSLIGSSSNNYLSIPDIDRRRSSLITKSFSPVKTTTNDNQTNIPKRCRFTLAHIDAEHISTPLTLIQQNNHSLEKLNDREQEKRENGLKEDPLEFKLIDGDMNLLEDPTNPNTSSRI
ncbi:uncharacterized protein LOC135929606 isoform X2 [Gordionus sp. m RMFG-2023]